MLNEMTIITQSGVIVNGANIVIVAKKMTVDSHDIYAASVAGGKITLASYNNNDRCIKAFEKFKKRVELGIKFSDFSQVDNWL